MDHFYKRKGRFDFFESFENPLLNICYELETPDFRPYCKAKGLPVFHFFLYVVLQALDKVDNFKYRIYHEEIIKIDRFIGSYTVINDENQFNYTRFNNDPDLHQFIKNSLAARDTAMNSPVLLNTGADLSERDMKNYVFITSIPWLKFTSIEHPVFKFKSADIPGLAWGKFSDGAAGKLLIPFSVQAHHGFVDGFHIHLLGEKIKAEIQNQMLSK